MAETGDDGKIVIDSDVKKPLEDIDALEAGFTRLEENIKKGGTGAQRTILVLAQEIERLGEESALTADEVDQYTSRLLKSIPAAAKAREETEKLQRSIQFAGKGGRDFAKDLGIPLDKLALYGIAVSSVKSGLDLLAKEGYKPLGDAMGLSAEGTTRLGETFDALSHLLRGDVIGAIQAVINKEAELIAVSNATLTARGLAAKAIIESIEAHKNERLAIEQDSIELQKLLEWEKTHGGLTVETAKKIDALAARMKNLQTVDQAYVETIKKTAEAYGVSELALTERSNALARDEQDLLKMAEAERRAGEAASDAGQSIMMSFDEGGSERIREQAKAMVEHAAATKDSNEALGEEALILPKTYADIDDIVKARREARGETDDGTESVKKETSALAGLNVENVKLKQNVVEITGEAVLQGEALEKLKDKVRAAMIEWVRQAKPIPPALQAIADKYGVILTEADKASAGAQRFADQFRKTLDDLNESTKDVVDGYALMKREGTVTFGNARDILETVVDKMNEYVKAGKPVPETLKAIARETGAIVAEQQRQLDTQKEINDAYEKQLELAGGAVDMLNKAAAAAGEVADAFEGLPDDGTGGIPESDPATVYHKGREVGENYGRGVADGYDGSGAPGTSSGGGAGGAGGDNYEARKDAYYKGFHGVGELPPSRQKLYNPGELKAPPGHGVGGVASRPVQHTHAGISTGPISPMAIDTALSPDGFFQGVLHLYAQAAEFGAGDMMSEAMAAAEGEYYEGPAVVSKGSFTGPMAARFFETAKGYIVGSLFYPVAINAWGGGTDANTLPGGGFGGGPNEESVGGSFNFTGSPRVTAPPSKANVIGAVIGGLDRMGNQIGRSINGDNATWFRGPGGL